jgi:hypothetical protein
VISSGRTRAASPGPWAIASAIALRSTARSVRVLGLVAFSRIALAEQLGASLLTDDHRLVQAPTFPSHVPVLRLLASL